MKKNDWTHMVGRRFGHWLVVSEAESVPLKDGRHLRRYNCLCDCGKEKIICKPSLIQGRSKSCGCSREVKIKDEKRHLYWKSRIGRIHRAMVARCYNKNAKSYNNYGGRGIDVCDEWIGVEGGIRFYEWALNNGYDELLTIDRIDNNKGYSPDNCRWSTNKEQCNNTRVNKYLTHNGETKTITQWAEQLGLSSGSIIIDRIKRGWSIEQAVTTRRVKPYQIIHHK